MSTHTPAARDHVYISCLTYLAAEAEREDNHIVAEIIKSATSSIYDWMQYGSDESPKDMNDFIDSLTAAFLFMLQHNDLPAGKKSRMLGLINAFNRAKLN